MKQFNTIFKYELKNYFKNKVFISVTLFLVLLIIIVMFFPRIMDIVKSGEDEKSKEMPIMLICSFHIPYGDVYAYCDERITCL